MHTNMAGLIPAEIDAAAFSGAPVPAGFSDDEKRAYERVQFVYDARSYELIARVFDGQSEGLTRDDISTTSRTLG